MLHWLTLVRNATEIPANTVYNDNQKEWSKQAKKEKHTRLPIYNVDNTLSKKNNKASKWSTTLEYYPSINDSPHAQVHPWTCHNAKQLFIPCHLIQWHCHSSSSGWFTSTTSHVAVCTRQTSILSYACHVFFMPTWPITKLTATLVHRYSSQLVQKRPCTFKLFIYLFIHMHHELYYVNVEVMTLNCFKCKRPCIGLVFWHSRQGLLH